MKVSIELAGNNGEATKADIQKNIASLEWLIAKGEMPLIHRTSLMDTAFILKDIKKKLPKHGQTMR